MIMSPQCTMPPEWHWSTRLYFCLSVCVSNGWPVTKQRDTPLTFTLAHCDGRLMDGEQGWAVLRLAQLGVPNRGRQNGQFVDNNTQGRTGRDRGNQGEKEKKRRLSEQKTCASNNKSRQKQHQQKVKLVVVLVVLVVLSIVKSVSVY